MIVVVGARQKHSFRQACAGCGKLLEYLREDLRSAEGLLYLDCPRTVCRKANYLGTEAAFAGKEKPGQRKPK